MNVTVEIAHEIQLERISKRCVTLQQSIESHLASIEEIEEAADLQVRALESLAAVSVCLSAKPLCALVWLCQAAEVDALLDLQKKIEEELDEARMSTEQQMWSSLLHDEMQMFDIEELKLQLDQKGQDTAKKISDKQERYRALQASTEPFIRC